MVSVIRYGYLGSSQLLLAALALVVIFAGSSCAGSEVTGADLESDGIVGSQTADDLDGSSLEGKAIMSLRSLQPDLVFYFAEESSTEMNELLVRRVVKAEKDDLCQHIYGEITYDPASISIACIEWCDWVEDNDQYITAVLDNGKGTLQFGICAIGDYRFELPDTKLANVNLGPAGAKQVSTMQESDFIRNRVPDLETIYFHTYTPGVMPGGDSACLSDIMLTWSYVLQGDTNFDTMVTVNDLTAIGQYFEKDTDYDTSFIPSTDTKIIVYDEGGEHYEVLEPSRYQSLLKQVDTNFDGLITVSDLTPLGQGMYCERNYGWSAAYQRGSQGVMPVQFSDDGVTLYDEVKTCDLQTYVSKNGIMSPKITKARRYQYTRSVNATQSLLTSIPLNPYDLHSFSLTSYYDPFGTPAPRTMESLKRTSQFHGMRDDNSISMATTDISSTMGAGPVAAMVRQYWHDSYIVVASAKDATISNEISVYGYDATLSPPSLTAIPLDSTTIPEMSSITDLKCGDYGMNYYIAVLGEKSSQHESCLCLFRFTAGSLADKLVFDVPYKSNFMVSDYVVPNGGEYLESIIVWPTQRQGVYSGNMYTMGASGLFEIHNLNLGEGASVGIAADLTSDYGYDDNFSDTIISLVTKNNVVADMLLVNKLGSINDVISLGGCQDSPLGGLTADYGRSLGDTVGWNLSDMTENAYMSCGKFYSNGSVYNRSMLVGYKNFPLFAHWIFDPVDTQTNGVALHEDSFCLDIYRNLVDKSGNIVDTKINGVTHCNLQSNGDGDVAYITENAIGWRMAASERKLWSDTYNDYIKASDSTGGPKFTERIGSFGPIYLIGAEDNSVFNPQHMACGPLKLSSDKDVVIVTAKVGSECRLVAISF